MHLIIEWLCDLRNWHNNTWLIDVSFIAWINFKCDICIYRSARARLLYLFNCYKNTYHNKKWLVVIKNTSRELTLNFLPCSDLLKQKRHFFLFFFFATFEMMKCMFMIFFFFLKNHLVEIHNSFLTTTKFLYVTICLWTLLL